MTKRTKPSADAEEVTKRPQAARQAAKSAKAAKGSRAHDKGSRRPQKPSGRAKPAGRVVALGVDVPTVDGLATVKREREQFEQEVKRRPGQPTGYRPEYSVTARAMCRLGACDYNLAEEFGVTVQTIWLWRCTHREFSDALLEGKEAFDDRIERSLAMRAAGYSVHTEKVFQYEGSIIRANVVEHYPPDVGQSKCGLATVGRTSGKTIRKSNLTVPKPS